MFEIKPEWQAMSAATETIADALRASTGVEVIASSIEPAGDAPIQGWINLRMNDGRQMLLRAEFKQDEMTDPVGASISMDGYELPRLTGAVLAEKTRLTSRFYVLAWSNPTNGPSPSAFHRLRKAQKIEILQAESRLHRQMYEQAYAERKAQVPASHEQALEEAWAVIVAVLDQQEADLAKGLIK